MELKKRTHYTREYKEDVVNMIKTGDRTVPEIAKELDIASGILYRWYREFSNSSNVEKKKITEQDKELSNLRKKLAEVEEERDILKKAISIFSKEGKNA